MQLLLDDKDLPYKSPDSVKICMSCGTLLNVTVWENRITANKGPVCLLIHGLDNNARIWNNIANSLCNYSFVYALDIRGHGDSEWCHQRHYNRERLVQDIEEIRQSLSIEKMYLIGHSLGAGIACAYAYKYTDIVDALVLCDMGLDTNRGVFEMISSNYSDYRQIYESKDDYYSYLRSIYLLADATQLRMYADSSIYQDGHTYHTKNDPNSLLAFSREVIQLCCPPYSMEDRSSYLWGLLDDIRTPMLVLKGEYSSVLSLVAAQRVVANHSNRALEIIQKSGHSIMLDNPQQTLAAIDGYISQHISSHASNL